MPDPHPETPETPGESPEQRIGPSADGDTPLDRDAARTLVDESLEPTAGLEPLARWLVAAADRGETAEEIAGVADALRGKMLPVVTKLPVVADTCGTGGDGSGTFNISTAAAIVVAAAGIPVAKHGNRAVSSRTGSADVLEALGVRIELAADQAAECLSTIGLCFCLAPVHHPAMAHVRSLRRSLGRPTVFNLVGPLCNPAAASLQLIGVGNRRAREALAGAAAAVGLRRAVIVSGAIGEPDDAAPRRWLDEVSLFGPTDVIDVRGGTFDHAITQARWRPEDYGLATLPARRFDELLVEGAEGSAAVIRAVLAGQEGPCRDVVVLNAASLLRASATGGDAVAAREVAEEAIDSGRAGRLLEALIRCTRSFPASPSPS